MFGKSAEWDNLAKELRKTLNDVASNVNLLTLSADHTLAAWREKAQEREIQKCPVCNGSGTVEEGFYHHKSGESYIAFYTTQSFVPLTPRIDEGYVFCRLCHGSGVVGGFSRKEFLST